MSTDSTVCDDTYCIVGTNNTVLYCVVSTFIVIFTPSVQTKAPPTVRCAPQHAHYWRKNRSSVWALKIMNFCPKGWGILVALKVARCAVQSVSEQKPKPVQRVRFAGVSPFSSTSVDLVAVLQFGWWEGAWGAGGGRGHRHVASIVRAEFNKVQKKNGFWWQKSLVFSDQNTRRHKPACLAEGSFSLCL